jgi:hypothetical protein
MPIRPHEEKGQNHTYIKVQSQIYFPQVKYSDTHSALVGVAVGLILCGAPSWT